MFVSILPGTYREEPASIPCSCHGVFTDRSVLSLNLSRIQIPTGTSMINCSHKQGLMLTCRLGHVHVRLHCFIPTEAYPCRLVKMPLYWLIWRLQNPSNGLLFLLMLNLELSGTSREYVWEYQFLLMTESDSVTEILSYFGDHLQNYLQIEGNLKIIVCEDRETPKR